MWESCTHGENPGGEMVEDIQSATCHCTYYDEGAAGCMPVVARRHPSVASCVSCNWEDDLATWVAVWVK